MEFRNIKGWVSKLIGPPSLLPKLSSIQPKKKHEENPEMRQVFVHSLLGNIGLMNTTELSSVHPRESIGSILISSKLLEVGAESRPVCYNVLLTLSCLVQIMYGISGNCKPGEVLALMGPSGSSKTSVLSVVGGRTPE